MNFNVDKEKINFARSLTRNNSASLIKHFRVIDGGEGKIACINIISLAFNGCIVIIIAKLSSGNEQDFFTNKTPRYMNKLLI